MSISKGPDYTRRTPHRERLVAFRTFLNDYERSFEKQMRTFESQWSREQAESAERNVRHVLRPTRVV